MARQTKRYRVDVSERIAAGIERLVQAGEFGTGPEYIRSLIHNDLAKRLADLDRIEGKSDPVAEH